MELTSFVKESVQLLTSAIPESVRIIVGISADECQVVADPVQMQQLITNLAVNAADAMPDGGRLRIDLAPVQVEDGRRPPVPEMAPGRWVQLRVADSGRGMSQAVRERLFEPFFTTKEPGQGTGLGLAQVYGIVKQHEGHIAVDSEEGVGSMFTVWLPAADDADQIEVREDGDGETRGGRGQLVMVVEDEPAILEVTREGLSELGYRVITAGNGKEALQLLDQHGERVALILSDLVMPGMGGLELARKLQARGERAKILLMTGYPLEKDSGEHLALGIVDWLQKPFTMERLAEAITSVLS
jgi:CheY-like chemotaxis protein